MLARFREDRTADLDELARKAALAVQGAACRSAVAILAGNTDEASPVEVWLGDIPDHRHQEPYRRDGLGIPSESSQRFFMFLFLPDPRLVDRRDQSRADRTSRHPTPLRLEESQDSRAFRFNVSGISSRVSSLLGIDEKQLAPNRVIVDGQQRLTSLYAVLKGIPVIRENYASEKIEIAFNLLDDRNVLPADESAFASFSGFLDP